MIAPTPRQLVSDRCIAFTERILSRRRALHSDLEAVQIGKDLFDWFNGQNALTEENAPIAARCVELGLTLLETSVETTDRIVEQVRDAYTHFAP